MLSSSQVAEQLFLHHTNLFEATDEIELIVQVNYLNLTILFFCFQVVGREKFNGRNPSNLDILLRRFNEIQFWTTTEILLAPNPNKRVNVLKKFVKIAL